MIFRLVLLCYLDEENLLSGTGGARLGGLLGRESELEVLDRRTGWMWTIGK